MKHAPFRGLRCLPRDRTGRTSGTAFRSGDMAPPHWLGEPLLTSLRPDRSDRYTYTRSAIPQPSHHSDGDDQVTGERSRVGFVTCSHRVGRVAWKLTLAAQGVKDGG